MIGKQKGVKKSILALTEKFKNNYNPEISNSVYILDACESDYADELEKNIKEIAPNCVIKRKLITPIVGAHLGSGAVLITFWG